MRQSVWRMELQAGWVSAQVRRVTPGVGVVGVGDQLQAFEAEEWRHVVWHVFASGD